MLTALVCLKLLVRIRMPLGSTVRLKELETSCWDCGVFNCRFYFLCSFCVLKNAKIKRRCEEVSGQTSFDFDPQIHD